MGIGSRFLDVELGAEDQFGVTATVARARAQNAARQGRARGAAAARPAPLSFLANLFAPAEPGPAPRWAQPTAGLPNWAANAASLGEGEFIDAMQEEIDTDPYAIGQDLGLMSEGSEMSNFDDSDIAGEAPAIRAGDMGCHVRANRIRG